VPEEGVAADRDLPTGEVEQGVVDDGGGVEVKPSRVAVDPVAVQLFVEGLADQLVDRAGEQAQQQPIQHRHPFLLPPALLRRPRVTANRCTCATVTAMTAPCVADVGSAARRVLAPD